MIIEPFLKIWQLANDHEFTSLFIWIFLEEAGVPMPVPGDIFIANFGRRLPEGRENFLQVLWVVTLATVVGTSILYLVARKLGRGLVFKYLRFLHIDQAKMKKVEGWFQIHGGLVLVFGRLTPGFRIITPLMAGFFKIPYHIFIFYTTLATVVWVAIYFFLGRFLGQNFIPIFKFFFKEHPYLTYPLVLILGTALLKYLYGKVFVKAKGGS